MPLNTVGNMGGLYYSVCSSIETDKSVADYISQVCLNARRLKEEPSYPVAYDEDVTENSSSHCIPSIPAYNESKCFCAILQSFHN